MSGPLVSFEGLGAADNTSVHGFNVLPPDTVGDVGPNHYVQMVNLVMAVYDKTGTLLLGPIATSSIWSGFTGPCEDLDSGDPIVLYDPMADRWLISQFAIPDIVNGPFHECIAISTTGDPTGSYHRYDFIAHATKLNDYPKFGVWPDGYYMSANQFNRNTLTYAGVGVFAFDRTAMLAGAAATMIYFDLVSSQPNSFSLLPADLDGPVLPPAGAPNYFAELGDNAFGFASDRIQIFEFHVDFATPANSTFTGPLVLATNSFDQNMCGFSRDCIPQPGTAQGVDGISGRAMHRLQYRNFGTHQTLVMNQTVDENSSDHAGVNWYELHKVDAGAWSINQQGTYAPDTDHRWMGSIAMDGDGNIAIGFSVSSGTTFPSIRYAGRRVGDPLGSMSQGEATLIAGAGSQTHSAARWGDYSALSVDPVDDCTFWYTNEYYSSTSSATWQSRIGSFRIPTCPLPDSHQLSGVDIGGEVAIFGRSPVDVLWYRETTSGVFGAWTQVGSGIAGRPEAVYDGSDTYVFFRGTDDALRYYEKSSGSWGTQQSLGGAIAGTPAAAVDGDGDIIVVVLTDVGTIFYERYTGAGWSGYAGIAGVLQGPIDLVGSGGDLHLFGRDLTGVLWTRVWDETTNAWGSWASLGGILGGGPAAAEFGSDLYVFGTAPDGGLWYQDNVGGGWNGWNGLGGVLSDHPDLAATASELVVASANPDGNLWQRTENAGFGAWSPLGGVLSAGPELVGVGASIYAFGINDTGNLWYRLWNGTIWGAWANLDGILDTE